MIYLYVNYTSYVIFYLAKITYSILIYSGDRRQAVAVEVGHK